MKEAITDKVISELQGEPLSNLRIEVVRLESDDLLVVVTFGSGEENFRGFAFSVENARVLGSGILAACEMAGTTHAMLQAQERKAAQDAKPTQRSF